MNATAVSPGRLPKTMIAIIGAAAIAILGMGPSVASAQGLPSATGDEGWVRVAHLSPDTTAVDIRISAQSGGSGSIELNEIGYGVVSDYMLLAAGTYVLSMTPADAEAGTEPVIDASIEVTEDRSITVAAFGANRDLRTRVFQDDLTAPEAGSSRIRLIQASTGSERVSVETTTGLLIAKDAEAGQSTSYASVPAGPWDLELTAEGIDDVAAITLTNGSVNTLFVLDNADGGLTVMPVLDSASVGAAPIGGVQTGGGALRHQFTGVLDDIGA